MRCIRVINSLLNEPSLLSRTSPYIIRHWCSTTGILKPKRLNVYFFVWFVFERGSARAYKIITTVVQSAYSNMPRRFPDVPKIPFFLHSLLCLRTYNKP